MMCFQSRPQPLTTLLCSAFFIPATYWDQLWLVRAKPSSLNLNSCLSRPHMLGPFQFDLFSTVLMSNVLFSSWMFKRPNKCWFITFWSVNCQTFPFRLALKASFRPRVLWGRETEREAFLISLRVLSAESLDAAERKLVWVWGYQVSG